MWLGVSCERQQEADERIPELLATPAAIRFLSCEPLLGALNLDLGPHDCPQCNGSGSIEAWGDEPGGQQCPSCTGSGGVYRHLDWIIVGGESGPGARPMHPDWARSIRDQCASAGVPFFFKQWGEWLPHKAKANGNLGGDVRAGRVRIVHPSGRTDVEVFKATGGRNTEPGSRYMIAVGKSRAGRLLDGREHNDMPRPANRSEAA